MGQNVWVKCGRTFNLLSDATPPTGAITGEWLYKDSPYASFQAVVNGTGAVSATITIQGSNDRINAVSTPLGIINAAGTTSASDGFTTIASWKYVRAVVSAPSGIITSITTVMGV